MLGNTSTRAFFASAHVIQMLSNVWAEWNYNNIAQPYVTYSTTASPIYFGPNKANSGSWVGTFANVDSSAISVLYTGSTSIPRDSINVNRTIPSKDYFFSGNNSGSNVSTAISLGDSNSSGVVSASYTSSSKISGYYKASFFVKGNISYISGYLKPVTTLNVSTSGVGNKPGAGSSSYLYTVQSVGEYGQMSNFMENKFLTVNGVQSPSSSSPIKLLWSSLPGDAVAFNVYRATTNISGSWSTFAYLNTVQNTTDDNNVVIQYLDTKTTVDPWNAYSAFNTEKIFLTPIVTLANGTSLIKTDSYVKFTDISSGGVISDDSTIKLDGIGWQKVDVYFNSNNLNFDLFNIKLNIFALFNNPSINITPIWIYPISEFEYTDNKLFPLESIFSGRRPGEALLNPFLATLNSRGLNYYTDKVDANNPIRNLTYTFMNPNSVWDIKNNMQIIPSYFDKYQYYISDYSTYPYSTIQARYDQYLSINKIYVKINNQLTTVADSNSSSLTLYFNTTSGAASSIYIPGPFKFDNNGISVFYYKNGGWLNSSGSAFSSSVYYAANLGTTTAGGWLPPEIGNNGQISTNQVFDNLTGIKLTLNYTANSNLNLDDKDKRLHVVEISPRLEVDVTNYVESYSFDKELDRGDTSANFPMGYITSNNGNIVINNFPVYYNNQPFTIFENKSPQSKFYDLMRQGVKFTGYFYSPTKRTDFNQPVPAFSLYANTWEVNDINNINVSLYDSTQHYMMSNEAPQYVAKGESLFNIITHLLALSGFSDYSQKELKEICGQRTNLAYFWTDEQKSTIQCLQEIFIANQIGAFIDETGFLRFIDIDKIIARKKLTYSSGLSTDFLLSDSTTASWTNWANIVEGSYHENLDAKIGKIIINYVQPNTSISPEYKTAAGSLPSQTITTKKIFSEDTAMGLGHTFLSTSMNTNDHEFSLFVNGSLDLYSSPRNNPGYYSGNFFIGCEAVYAEGMEYLFMTSGSPGYSYAKIIRTESDIQDAIQESLSQLGTTQKDITYKPTGNFVGVSRGLYGTSAKDHPVYTKDNLPTNNFARHISGLKIGSNTPKTIPFTAAYINTDCSFSAAVYPGTWSLIRSKDYAIASYDHFSITFKVDDAGVHAKEGGIGIFYNLYTNGEDADPSLYVNAPMFFIEKDLNNSSKLCMTSWDKKYKNIISAVIDTKTGLPSEYIYDIDLKKDLFDGKVHRLSIWFKSGQLFYRVDDESIEKINFYGTTNAVLASTYFGVFAYGADAYGTNSDQQFTTTFYEIYASEWCKVDNGDYDGDFDFIGNPKYHIQTKTFLSDMAYGIREPGYYLWQNRPHIIGFKHYKNTKFQIGPIFINNNKADYMGYELNAQNSNELLRIRKEDLAVAYPKLSPFYFNQIVVNNTSGLPDRRTLLLLNSPNGSIANSYGQTINITPYQLEAEVLNLTTETSYQRVINSNHINNSIGIQTNWIQSERDAKNLIYKVSNLLPTFNSTVSLDIFGNPLIETGDIVGLWYKLKGIGFDSSGNVTTPQRYFVSSVKHDWDGSLKTSLVLKPL